MTHAQQAPTLATLRGLVALPIVCGLLLVFVALHYEREEPFGGFVLQDALIEIGGPLLLLAAWVRWFLVAWKRRMAATVWLVAAGWCLLTLWAVGYYLISYFRSPWAWYVPG